MGRKKKNPEKKLIKEKNKKERFDLAKVYIDEIDELINIIFAGVLDQMETFNNRFDTNAKVYLEAHHELILNRMTLKTRDIMHILHLAFTKTGEKIFDPKAYKNADEVNSKKTNFDKKIKDNFLMPLTELSDKTDEEFDRIRKRISEISLELPENHREYILSIIIHKVENRYHEYKVGILADYYDDNIHLENVMQAREMLLSFSSELVNMNNDKLLEQIELEEKRIELEKLELEESNIDSNINNRIRCTYKDMHGFLESMGFEQERQNSTTHLIFKNSEGVSVPIPNKPKSHMCPPGTMHSILRQSNLTKIDLNLFLQGKQIKKETC